MEYSLRLGSITGEQFQKTLNRFDLGKLLLTERIPYGNFGQNVFVTATTGEYVLRGNPHYAWQFPSERFMANLLHQHTHAPVPYPYLLDEKTDIFGWSYVIMPRLKGQQLQDPIIKDRLSSKDQREIAKAFGENLAELHTLRWNFSGQYDLRTGSIKAYDQPFDQLIVDKIHTLVKLCATHNNQTPAADIAWIDSLLADGAEAMAVSFTPTFVMHDYQASNMVVDRVDGCWKVAGVFDLMENFFGNGEVDLPRMFIAYAESNIELAYCFLNAYVAKHELRPGFAKRFPIYMLMDRLTIWEWAQRSGAHWWDSKLTFRDWCGEFSQIAEDRIVRS